MYSGGFYPFDTLEEYWAWWSRHIFVNRYAAGVGKPYTDLLELVREKDYFVLTTNVDHQFQLAGFDKKRMFYTQGDYGLWQCAKPCHEKTYDNAEAVRRMIEAQGFRVTENGDMELSDTEMPKMAIPSELVPRCPVCGQMEYPKICPCVIVGVIHEGKILVSRYRGGFTDHYALIAGFAEVGEIIEETAIRDVYEETHLSIKNLRYYKCQPWPYSESLLFGFFAELDGADDIVIEEDELSMAKWVSPEEIFEEPNDFSLTNEMLCLFRNSPDGLIHF